MKSKISGVNFYDLSEIIDIRVPVLHMIRSDSDGFEAFGECYLSEILPDKIKAWKKHKEQTQNISIAIGEIILVIYDGRKESNTFKNMIIANLWERLITIKRVKFHQDYGMTSSKSKALIINCPNIPHDNNSVSTTMVLRCI